VSSQQRHELWCRHSSESWEAVGALARHVVLKAPDKADYRAVATEAAVTLMCQLPTLNQHQFVLFAARLARTPKVDQVQYRKLIQLCGNGQPPWSRHCLLCCWHGVTANPGFVCPLDDIVHVLQAHQMGMHIAPTIQMEQHLAVVLLQGLSEAVGSGVGTGAPADLPGPVHPQPSHGAGHPSLSAGHYTADTCTRCAKPDLSHLQRTQTTCAMSAWQTHTVSKVSTGMGVVLVPFTVVYT